MEKAIEVSGVSFQFGGEPLLSDISFEVFNKDFAAVIGSNGAGKSTLLRLLLGELAPISGEIRLFGENIAHFKNWNRIGYVPQTNPVSGGAFPATVEEIVLANMYAQIGAFRAVKKIHREKVVQALSLVEIQGLRKRMISELSGGQLQRVMIARALAADCDMMILDEPTTGVDYDSTNRLYELLKQLNGDGMTILMVTHDMQRSFEVVSRTLCLEQGTIVELEREQLRHELMHKHKH